ncbi:MAG TPA: hypothetical protein VF505_14540 [Thermoanaerobaculia bacterium]
MRFFRDFVKNRGTRVIICPETGNGAAVRIDALHAARTAEVRLADCTRWPERAGCDEGCLPQIEESPHGCLVHFIAADWYLGKSCVSCKRPIGPIPWHEASPAILKKDGTTSEWKDIPPQYLPELFGTSKPLCWYCNNVAELERLQPELITRRTVPVERAKEPLRSESVY